MSAKTGLSIHINGIVQGVGFRPFVYNLAVRLGLTGWVRNTSAGVDIEVDGTDSALEEFVERLRSELPPLAQIHELKLTERLAVARDKFEIIHSDAIPGAFQPISPDVSICPDCLRELFDPADRRHRYPFINCTNCGPRFTIIQDIPYDRPKTTMAGFPMCPACAAEYEDPSNRRFHAQPVACPVCGPRVWLEIGKLAHYHLPESQTKAHLPTSQFIIGDEAIQRSRALLTDGKILAIKGLGGFHLACDATSDKSVAELRQRKLRVDKPFAVMMPDIDAVENHCFVTSEERELLLSPARPIVLLRRRPDSIISPAVAPGQDTLGVMLPYTPLHYLLLERTSGFPLALVMTSGNLSDEPICTDNVEARQRLASLADAFLMHDRDIHIRADDSVTRVFKKAVYPIRRSRGYSPFPVQLPWEVPPLLAAGAELKNTFCITNGNYAFLSHHIGDLENYETLQSFEAGIQHFAALFRVQPKAIAYDLHPNYLATRYAIERAECEGLPTLGVQHHHAHIAAVMAEHGLDGSAPVLGVSFDGTGYGEDGAIWGGEFLVADYAGFKRAAHLKYFPLPGGDAATRRPSRTALGLLHALGIDWEDALETLDDLCYEDRTAIRAQLARKINTPLTSSVGRLFDAAAALAGVRQQVNYEAQAAIEFEALADPGEGCTYHFDTGAEIDPKPAFEALLVDMMAGLSPSIISARFHNGLARMVAEMCVKLSDKFGVSEVALSGGVWQNITLLEKTIRLLDKEGFHVYIHQRVPANDGGLALGQAAIAGYKLKAGL
jgi:hydrogenase maturation protein HypF